MTHTFEVTTSHARLRSYCVQVEGACRSLPELADKANEWAAMKKRVVGHRAEVEDSQDALTVAQAVNRVRDSNWDASYTEGSGLAYVLSKKKPTNDPYATVMRVPAKRAVGFGYAKATGVGDQALKAVARFALPALTEWARGFAPLNEALKASGQAMKQAEDALDDPRFSKKALVREVSTLADLTEVAILTAFPGRSDLVDAILVPAWVRKGGSGKADGGAESDADTEVDPDVEDATSETPTPET